MELTPQTLALGTEVPQVGAGTWVFHLRTDALYYLPDITVLPKSNHFLTAPFASLNFAPSKSVLQDFPGGPVVKTECPMQGAWAHSLVRELDPAC